jgi:hypothetical protein
MRLIRNIATALLLLGLALFVGACIDGASAAGGTGRNVQAFTRAMVDGSLQQSDLYNENGEACPPGFDYLGTAVAGGVEQAVCEG